MITLRSSALPLAFRCAGSVQPVSVRIESSEEPARLGSAVHEALRPMVEGGQVPWDRLPEIAQQWDADPDDLRMLCAIAAKLWPNVSESFKDALTEVELSADVAPGVTLMGHVDLLSVSGAVARAGDWKSGRKDHDYSHQMRAYGALILLDQPELTEVTVTILWIRDGEIENYTVTRDSAREWLASLRDTVIGWDGVYRPGSHCGHCKRNHECEAAKALVRRDVAAFIGQAPDEGVIASLAPDQKLSLYRKATMVIQYADRVRKALKADVESNGDVVTTDGRLTVVEEPRRELDPLAAWPVLEAVGFRDADFANVVDVSVTRVEKIVATRAGRGKGAAAVRALAEKLGAANAVKLKAVRKLQEKPR